VGQGETPITLSIWKRLTDVFLTGPRMGLVFKTVSDLPGLVTLRDLWENFFFDRPEFSRVFPESESP